MVTCHVTWHKCNQRNIAVLVSYVDINITDHILVPDLKTVTLVQGKPSM